MSTPFLSELRIVSFNFAPKGWAECNGQLLPINQNQALFSLLGTTYGGDGQVNFALPNLQGRAPAHMGGGLTLGEVGGETAHTLSVGELGTHTHPFLGTSAAATSGNPTGNTPAVPSATVGSVYAPGPANTPLAASQLTGGGQPHDNMQPYLVINYVIALQGIFPSRN